MSSLALMLLAIGILPQVGIASALIAAFFTLFFIVSTLVYMTRDDCTRANQAMQTEWYPKWMKRLIAAMVIPFFIAAMMPSKETLVLVAAAEVGQRIVNSDRVTQVLDPSIGLLRSYIEAETISVQKRIEDLRKEKK